LTFTNDGQAFRVGKTCIGRVGLELTGSEKTVWRRKHRKVAEPKPRVEEPKEMHPGFKKALEEQKKKEIEELLKEIRGEDEIKKKPEKREEQPKVEDDDEFNLDDIFDD